MNTLNNYTDPVDLRINIYRLAKRLAFILALAVVVKLVFFDTVAVTTNLMAPSLIAGDRVLVSKLAYSFPFKLFFEPKINSIVIMRDPSMPEKFFSYRLAALPGDSVYIDQGVFHNASRPDMEYLSSIEPEDIVPPDFSPRDYLQPLKLPRKGDEIHLDSLQLRDLIFTISMIRQENPDNEYAVKARIFIDGKEEKAFELEDFTLFDGKLDSIPPTFHFNYFFWDRLKAYLINTNKESDVELAVFCEENGKRLFKYKLKKSYIFLLSDDWQRGYDSRFIGPRMLSSVKGRVRFVLWSFKPGEPFFKALRTNRIMKIIK
ncbi:MAG: signal peptidase I [Chitinivibrionales bacterium]|nr:signal peptidase I [Chitinivibrionales bacterium]